MITKSTGAARADTSELIGVRTRGSDLIRWAIWTGDCPVELYQWVRLVDTGELGRVSIAPGRTVGVHETDSLPQVSLVNDADMDSDDTVEPPAPGAWGRIGCRTGPVKNAATAEMESPESIKYRKLKADMPALGEGIATDYGTGVVIGLNVFTGRLSVRIDMSSDVVEVQHRALPLADANNTSSTNTANDQSA